MPVSANGSLQTALASHERNASSRLGFVARLANLTGLGRR